MVKLRGPVLAWCLLAGPAHGLDWSRAGGGLVMGQDAGAAAPAIDAPDALAPAPPAPAQRPYGDLIEAAAARHGLDPKLLHALVLVESGYRASAVSHAGAAGLTQLMPATAKDLGVVDRFDPEENLSGGADYLARQIRRFGDLRLALAAYNAGPARVVSSGGVPPIAETRAYVAKVVSCFLALSIGASVKSARDCSPEAGS